MWASAEYISQQAHVLSAQRFVDQFHDIFLPQYQRGEGQADLSNHALKAAGFLIDMFASAWQTIGQTVKIPKGKKKYQVPIVFYNIANQKLQKLKCTLSVTCYIYTLVTNLL